MHCHARWIVAILLMYCPMLHARLVLNQHSLDSLVYLSSVIVRGEIVSTATPPNAAAITIYSVIVDKAFAGDVKKADKISVSAMDNYWRSPGVEGLGAAWRTLDTHDVVYLFIADRNSPARANGGLDLAIVPSGVRLAREGKVYAFGDVNSVSSHDTLTGSSRYGYSTITHGPKYPVLREADFELQLAKSIAFVREIRPSLRTPAKAEEMPALETQLRERIANAPSGGGVPRDVVTELLAAKFATLAKPAVLEEMIEKSWGFTAAALETGLYMSSGRNYLLDQLAEAKDPKRRAKIASILSSAARTYGQEVRERKAAPSDEFATRLVTYALEDLTADGNQQLLRALGDAIGELPAQKQSKNLQNAIALMVKHYESADTNGQYTIAVTIARIDADCAKQFAPHTGPVLTLITHAKPFMKRNANQNDLNVRVRFRSLNRYGEATQLKLVLRTTKGEEHLVPTEQKSILNPNGSGSVNLKIPLPETLPAGHYHAFLRVYNGNVAVGDGYGFEIDTPLAP